MNDIPVLPPVPAAIADAVVIDDHASPPVVLVDREQKTDAAVQAWVETLCRSHPEVDVTFAGRTELAAFSGNPAATEGQSETQDKVIRLFRQACEVGASDIHLITEGNSGLIRMRVNGELYTVSEPPAREIMTMATTIYGTMCDASEPHLVETREQDARLKSTFLRQAGLFGARYSHRPKVGGLLIVMRTIPDDGDAAPTLDALGFLPEQINLIEELERRPEGVNALSGPTGSGKSTLSRLIQRHVDPDAGEVIINGHNARDLGSTNVCRAVVVADQNPFLMEATVAENLCLGAPDGCEVPESLMHWALEFAAINPAELPLDRPIGRRAQRLSGGQRQRLALARTYLRAVLADGSVPNGPGANLAGKIVIFDEATSHQDPLTQARIVDNARACGATCIFIAHRLQTLAEADDILVIENGQLIERGTYDNLLNADGAFARLARAQV